MSAEPHRFFARPSTRAGRHRTLAGCAFLNSAVIAMGLGSFSCSQSGCGRGSAAQASDPPPKTAQVKVRELIEALTPIDPNLTSDLLDEHFLRGRERLANLKSEGREVGLEALRQLRESTLHDPRAGAPGQAPDNKDAHKIEDIERGLLQVAAHAAPEDTRPLLEALVTQYGTAISLRTEAALSLAETSPERALVILAPMVTKARPTQTWPPAEFIVKAWVIACEKTGRSPVKELADVATNLFMDETARILATKQLGRHSDPLATQALSAILIESTGDGYLRRMAAQGLRDTLPHETACEIFTKVADREADLNMLQFLKDMLEKNCGF